MYTDRKRLLELARAVEDGSERALELAGQILDDEAKRKQQAQEAADRRVAEQAERKRLDKLKDQFYDEHVKPLAKRLQANATHLSTSQIFEAMCDCAGVRRQTNSFYRDHTKAQQFRVLAEVLLGISTRSEEAAFRKQEYKTAPVPDEEKVEAWGLILRSSRGGRRHGPPRFGVLPEDRTILEAQLKEQEAKLKALDDQIDEHKKKSYKEKGYWETHNRLVAEHRPLYRNVGRLSAAVRYMEKKGT